MWGWFVVGVLAIGELSRYTAAISADEMAQEVKDELSAIAIEISALRHRMGLDPPAVSNTLTTQHTSLNPVNPHVHAFYYPWYATPHVDGKWKHWDHEYMPHWRPEMNKRFATVIGKQHQPPRDIAAVHYPRLGPYSSADPAVISTHMADLRRAGIGVAVVSWFPPEKFEDHGLPLDPLMPAILSSAQEAGIQVAFHLEPYPGRGPDTVLADLQYLTATYGEHPAVLRGNGKGGRQVPVVYIYDSYHTKPSEWAKIFDPASATTIRGTPTDVVAIGLWLDQGHGQDLVTGGFDGAYTYFASPISYGAKPANWPKMSRFCKDHMLLFLPCVGPGYDDTPVRPWNMAATVDRREGQTYREAISRAVKLSPPPWGIAVTSFNEWHEGTQIEPAEVAEESKGLDYGVGGPDLYVDITRSELSNIFN